MGTNAMFSTDITSLKGRKAEGGGRRAEDGDLTKQRGKEIELVAKETPLGVKCQ